MASTNISTPNGRARLAARREPYFTRIAKAQHLGFRKLETGGTWVAKYTAGQARQYRALGSEAEIPEHAEALKLALAWFRDATEEDQPESTYTVQMAIDDYCADLSTRKGKNAGYRASMAAKRHITPKLGKIEVSKLRTKRVKAWLSDLVCSADDEQAVRRSKDSANRILTILKASLNLAFKDGVIKSDIEWRRVSPFHDVGSARDVYLSREQCKALLDACQSDFRDMVRSALLTGARYSELACRKVGDLDLKQGVLRVTGGKTGSRDIVLNDAACAHFKLLAKDKLPVALLHYRILNATAIKTDEPKALLAEWKSSDQVRRMRAAVTAANRSVTYANHLPVATCFYSLRHTSASLALLAGVNIQVLAENLGTSIRMIETHYGKFLHSDRRAQFNLVAAL